MGAVLDLAFLSGQTFGDLALEREVLTLFLAQAQRVLPALPELAPDRQCDAAHLLKGSARGIGAWGVADIAEKYEQAESTARISLQADLAAAFAEVETAIVARLGDLQAQAR